MAKNTEKKSDFRTPYHQTPPWFVDKLEQSHPKYQSLLAVCSLLQQEFPTFQRMFVLNDRKLVFEYKNPKPMQDLRTRILQLFVRHTLSYTPYLKYSLLDWQNGLKNIRSVTKSIVSALIGIALDQGILSSISQELHEFLPELINTPKAKITIYHMLTNTSGLQAIDHFSAMKTFLKSDDWTNHIVNLPLIQKPGEGFLYSSANFHLLTTILAKSLSINVESFAVKYLFAPLGINTFFWEKSADDIPFGGSNLFLHPEDMLRIGLLFLQKGSWQSKQLISKKWIDTSTKARIQVDEQERYGMGWWIMGAEQPSSGNYFDYFAACGVGGQRIFVIPKTKVVIAIICRTSLYANSRILDNIIAQYALDAFVENRRP